MTLENIVDICIGIDIAILGIAYPIIVDKISNIGDKYSSNYLSDVFNQEYPQGAIKLGKGKWPISRFKLALFLTVLTFLFQIFDAKSPLWLDCWLVNNSAKLIVLASSTYLTVLFFIWLDKVVLYNGKATSLIKHLIKRYNENSSDLYCLKAINEFAYFAVDKQDSHLQETLLIFYSGEFARVRRERGVDEPLEYPVDLYEFVNSLTFELSIKENKKLLALEHRAVSGVWLLGELRENVISKTTYHWLWRNIYIICDISRYVKMYWQTAFQYYDFQLAMVDEEYGINEDNQVIVLNKEVVDKRIEERKKFMEFHLLLGALLLYRKQYDTLDYIFRYTQSFPPKYALFPGGMTGIFDWFDKFRDEFRSSNIEYTYSFPELDSMVSRSEIRYWLCSYMSLLFVRMYTLKSFYTFDKFLNPPTLPLTISELRNWTDSISYFEKCLNGITNNKKLLKILEFQDVVKEQKNEMYEFIKKLSEDINFKIGETQKEAELSANKIARFEATTQTIIRKSLSQFSYFLKPLNKNIIDEGVHTIITGGKTLFSKSAFTDGDIEHLNFDSIIAETLSRNIEIGIPNSFMKAATKTYLLNFESIVEGINRLRNGQKDIQIVALYSTYNIQKLLTDNFENVAFLHGGSRQMSDSIILIRASDFPQIQYEKVDEDDIINYNLKLIDDGIKLYTSVIDINLPENSNLKNGISDSGELKVIAAVAFNFRIYWKRTREIVVIRVSSKFKEQGIENDLSELVAMNKVEI